MREWITACQLKKASVHCLPNFGSGWAARPYAIAVALHAAVQSPVISGETVSCTGQPQ